MVMHGESTRTSFFPHVIACPVSDMALRTILQIANMPVFVRNEGKQDQIDGKVFTEIP